MKKPKPQPKPHEEALPQPDQTSDQDNGWKEMLDGFFESFVVFFFPLIHADIDWDRGYEFKDKELPKLGREHATGKRVADKLVKVWLKDGRETWLLIHVEIQGRPEKKFNQRSYIYNYRIFDKENCEVISLVVVTGSGGARVGKYEVARWGFRLLCEFPVARVADYCGREDELQDSFNPFALVVLAQLKLIEAKGDSQKKLVAKRELIRSLLRRGRDDKCVISLLRFLDWVMVLPSELEQQLNYELEEEKKKMPYVTSWERMGFERGVQTEAQTMVLRQLTLKLGELNDEMKTRIGQLLVEKLEQLGEALLDFTEPQDLEKWLRQHARTRRRASSKNGSAH